MAESVIEVKDLQKYYPKDVNMLSRLRGVQRYIHAVDGISFDIKKGEVLGLAGESGCGKSTTAECLSMLTEPTAGEIFYGGEYKRVDEFDSQELKSYRKEVQIIFQDPFESINDRFTVNRWVKEPLVIHDIGSEKEQQDRVRESLELSGLTPAEEYIYQYPHELSGGERQRVAIARALVLRPSLIIADEPTSMLDVSIRAGIIKVLNKLVDEQGVSILYISHDIALLRYVCDRIGIMYRGELMEIGETDDVLQNPQHPYTQALVSAVPRADPLKSRERQLISSEVKEQIGGSVGCAFKDRCPYRFEKCDEKPPLMQVENQLVSCHLHDEGVNEEFPN